MQRWILHVDMDAFFASIEQQDYPELQGRPVIVGGGERGVVSAASYEARRFGVRSAMPISQARKLCPNGNFCHGRHKRYKELSRQVMTVLDGFSPCVEQASIDEAYLDITGTERLLGPPGEVGRALQQAIRVRTGLSASIGIAPNKFVAKIASDWDKPGGLTWIRAEQLQTFLDKLPVRKLPGVGPRTSALLERLGVESVGAVRRFSEAFWTDRLGEGGKQLWARAHGIDDSEVQPYHAPKSCGAEHTLPQDTEDEAILISWLLHEAERIGRELRREVMEAGTVTLKIRYDDFTTFTRCRKLSPPTQSTQDLYSAGVTLLRQQQLQRPVRLVGLSAGNLAPMGSGRRQLSFFEADSARRNSLDAAMDAVRERFGGTSVRRAEILRAQEGKGQSDPKEE
ncbi:DNA polymerase IV [Desulfohalobium retbaense]|uniref:DNA polymerase IV n=1 Tax=Desulfohalobium retbaense (strain ATCC 49708 / DSM 5692 / JCM 16813 / HR100) TaxID=485915 RepID=C8X3R0_DESRD|nr:DNA polymerase IV [Desulfohalobium retbaense]ACV69057.1 DNA-directed DNA polymerase [Desulfohalobium retbaense DSM 5692]